MYRHINHGGNGWQKNYRRPEWTALTVREKVMQCAPIAAAKMGIARDAMALEKYTRWTF
jgi:hypothetical protein